MMAKKPNTDKGIEQKYSTLETEIKKRIKKAKRSFFPCQRRATEIGKLVGGKRLSGTRAARTKSSTKSEKKRSGRDYTTLTLTLRGCET